MNRARIFAGLAVSLAAFVLPAASALALFEGKEGKGETGLVQIEIPGGSLECASASGTYKVEGVKEGLGPELNLGTEIVWSTCKVTGGFAATVTCNELTLEQPSVEGGIEGKATGKLKTECTAKTALGCEFKLPTTGNQKLGKVSLKDEAEKVLAVVEISGITINVTSGCAVLGLKSTKEGKLKAAKGILTGLALGAPEFTPEGTGKFNEAGAVNSVGAHKFFFVSPNERGNTNFVCNKGKFTGELGARNAQMEVIPPAAFEECKEAASGNAATVTTENCRYKYSILQRTEPTKYEGKMWLVNAGVCQIKLASAMCKIVIKQQAAALPVVKFINFAGGAPKELESLTGSNRLHTKSRNSPDATASRSPRSSTTAYTKGPSNFSTSRSDRAWSGVQRLRLCARTLHSLCERFGR